MTGRPDMPSPVDLWQQAGGGTDAFSRDEYRRLLLEHGLVVPGRPEPLPCGWTPGGHGEAPEHRAARQRTDAEQAAIEEAAR